MVDLIEYPANRVAADALPRPGDRYEPYGVAAKLEPVTLTLVSCDGSMCSLPYGRMGISQLESLDGSEGGEGRLSAFFETAAGGGILADVVGSNLGHCFSALADQRLRWIWQMPEGRAAMPEGSPTVRLIEFRRAAAGELFDLLCGG